MNPCGCGRPDSYVIFEGIDKKQTGIKGPKYGDLYMVHRSSNQVRELLEKWREAMCFYSLNQRYPPFCSS
jgi:hypothetical protein